jgi:syntaxin 5
VQIRQQERQSQQRLAEARQAERSLATLGTVFGKMSTLLSQQAEVVDKVEDDVEAALVDVSAGQQEITILYSIKKGNRALIIKVFAILIFFIIFMRIYKK